MHDGVYVIGPLGAMAMEARFLAAVLATGRGVVLSHLSAAMLWGLLPFDPDAPLQVTTTRGARGGAGIDAHRSRSLRRHHRTVLHDVPVTTLAKTIIDIAPLLPYDELVKVTAKAHREKRLTPQALQLALDEHRGGRGTKAVRQLLDDGLMVTRSEFERRFLAFAAEQGWPRPLVNRHVIGHRADFHRPDRRLIVEADGFAFHRDRLAFEDDHDRDLDWAVAGWAVRRITWRQMTKTPTKITRAVGPLLR